jgi:anaerobic selenocysteine-containing dehydrogenase
MPMSEAERTHYRSCHLCEAMCGVEIRVRGVEVLSVRGDAADPFSRGHVCAKALALKDVHEDPERLRQPLRRTATGWQPVPWDEALDEAAARLVEVQRRAGRDAVATYFGNPQVHGYGALLGGAKLVRALRSRNRYSATSVDQLPHHFAALFMFGHPLLLPIPDLDRTAFLLVLGGNPVVSNGSLMTAPDVAARLKALRSRGGRLVVVDPRRTETAELADTHHFIRPGTDALLLLAMLQVIFAEGLARPGRLEGFTDGLDALREACAAYPPERVAAATGIEAATIRGLARDFAHSESAIAYGRMGASTQAFGALAQWLTQALNVVTGNLDRAGGAMFTRPAFDLVGSGGGFGHGGFDRRRTRVRGLPEFGGEFPVAALAEEIDTPGEDRIRALVTAAGNPVLSTPNGRRLDAALAGLEFMVSIDFYLNETTRHAHLILPPTFALERDHYDLVFNALAIRNVAKYSPPVFARGPDARHDEEILAGLVERIEAHDPSRRPALPARLAARALTARRALALGLRFGPHGARLSPLSRGLTLGRLAGQPHGVDLGPLEPCLPARLRTPGRRIQLAPAPLLADLARLQSTLPRSPAPAAPPDDTLLLIGRRDPRSHNSWLHNSRRLVKGPPRCTLRLNPDDAAARGLRDGDLAELRSRTGALQVPVELTDELMRGVASLPHGWGHDRDGTRQAVAASRAGVSANDVTDEQFLDALSGNAALNGVPVTVRAVAG